MSFGGTRVLLSFSRLWIHICNPYLQGYCTHICVICVLTKGLRGLVQSEIKPDILLLQKEGKKNLWYIYNFVLQSIEYILERENFYFDQRMKRMNIIYTLRTWRLEEFSRLASVCEPFKTCFSSTVSAPLLDMFLPQYMTSGPTPLCHNIQWILPVADRITPESHFYTWMASNNFNISQNDVEWHKYIPLNPSYMYYQFSFVLAVSSNATLLCCS